MQAARRQSPLIGAAVAFVLCASTASHAQDVPRQPTLPEVVVEDESARTSESSESPTLIDEPYSDAPPVVSSFGASNVFNPRPSVGYAAPDSVTALKTAAEPLDVPGSIQSITRDLIDDQSARTTVDLLRNVSGVSPSIGGSANRTDDLLIRGFRVQGNSDDFRKNGFRDTSRVQRELANVERIEVLKGPAAALYGSVGEPAGIVNYLTKQPLGVRRDAVAAQFGSWDDYRFTLDSTGPLTSEDVTYRLNAAGQHTDSFRDFVFDERYFVAPVVRWRLGEETYLTVEGEYLRDRRVPDRGIVLYQGSLTAIPRSRFLGEPSDRASFQDGQVSAILTHNFADDCALRTGWVSNWSDEDRDHTDTRRLGGGGGGGNPALLQRRRFLQDALDQNHYWVADLTGSFELMAVEHRWLVGSEIGVTSRDDFTLQRNATDINVLNPVYGLPQPTPNQPRTQNFDNWQYSIYVQDLMAINDRWSLLAGVRQSWVDATSLDTQAGPNAMTNMQAATTPRFGVVYKLLDGDASLYAAYSESFSPLVGSTRLGTPFAPERGASFETGVKLQLIDERLWATFAGFDTFRRNVLAADPVDANFSVQLGEVESRGVEFDLLGQITERWSIAANAAYIDAHVTRDTQANLLGNRADNVPYFSGNLWTRYNVVDTCCRTFGAATGVIYVGDRKGDPENTFTLPSYARWDAALYYRRHAWQLRLYGENLLDTVYFASARNAERIAPGAPFTLRGTIEYVY